MASLKICLKQPGAAATTTTSPPKTARTSGLPMTTPGAPGAIRPKVRFLLLRKSTGVFLFVDFPNFGGSIWGTSTNHLQQFFQMKMYFFQVVSSTIYHQTYPTYLLGDTLVFYFCTQHVKHHQFFRESPVGVPNPRFGASRPRNFPLRTCQVVIIGTGWASFRVLADIDTKKNDVTVPRR